MTAVTTTESVASSLRRDLFAGFVASFETWRRRGSGVAK